MRSLILDFTFNTTNAAWGMFRGVLMVGIFAATIYLVNRKKKANKS